MPRLEQLAAAAGRVPEAVSLLLRHGRPPAVIYFGESPGDDLLATAVTAQWHRVRGTRPWYLTRHSDLFEGNPDVALTLDYSPPLAGALGLLGVPRYRLKYHDYNPAEDRSLAPAEHMINLMCASAGLPPMDDPVPRIYLTADEKAPYASLPPYVAFQSSVMSARMPIGNKEWFVDRMQNVVDRLRGRIDLVQVGVAADPVLRGLTDRRGLSKRENGAILAGAAVFVGLATFQMHLARAVGTPSVIVYGGREHPSQSGYPVNQNLYTAMDCSPCWLWNRCPYDRECMQRISAADVVAAVEVTLRKQGHLSPA